MYTAERCARNEILTLNKQQTVCTYFILVLFVKIYQKYQCLAAEQETTIYQCFLLHPEPISTSAIVGVKIPLQGSSHKINSKLCFYKLPSDNFGYLTTELQSSAYNCCDHPQNISNVCAKYIPNILPLKLKYWQEEEG